MMIIDSHTHTFPDTLAPKVIPALQAKAQSIAYTDGTDSGLRAAMKRANIDISIQLPVVTNPAQVEKLNDIAIRKNRHFSKTGLFSLGGMHPDYTDFAGELKRLQDNGITGIKLHPAYQGVDFDDVRYLRIIDKASELGLAVVIHAGLDIGIMHHNFASIAHIQNCLKTLSPDKLVLGHMGGWKGWNEVERELCGENVFFDTSFSVGAYVPPSGTVLPPEMTAMLSLEQFERMIKKHGADKILFGSDSPWSDSRQSIEQLRACELREEALSCILGENAQKLFFGSENLSIYTNC